MSVLGELIAAALRAERLEVIHYAGPDEDPEYEAHVQAVGEKLALAVARARPTLELEMAPPHPDRR